MQLTKLTLKNLLRHPLRSLLTVASLAVALFLLCSLRSLETTLAAVTEQASNDRMLVQSAVSLYVDLPLNYQDKINGVEGVTDTCKWQWFGGYYQEEQNQFGQFAIDPETFARMNPELVFIEGSYESFQKNRRGCVLGDGLAEKYGFKVGQTVPLIGSMFPHPEGPDVPWEFQVEAIYHPTTATGDPNGFFFHWDYFEKTLTANGLPTPGVGTIALTLAPGVDQASIASTIDGMFDAGPQRVQTTPEAEFNAQFVSMFGNIPFLVTSIGGAVLLAILLASLNTMLMAGREQTRDVGIMKALGFKDSSIFMVMISQGLALACVGGGLGILFAIATAEPIAVAMSRFFPGYEVRPDTIQTGIILTVIVGLLSGVLPAIQATRLNAVNAMRATE